MDVSPKKSLILKFPEEDIVSKELQSHFIRGYFDGDGSLLHSKTSKKSVGCYETFCFSFVGTKEFLEGVQKVLNINNKIFHDSRKDLEINTWVLNIRGNRQAIEVGKFLYENATIYLPRKHKIFQTLLNNY